MAKKKTVVEIRNHIDGLTLAQQSAVDLLVVGKSDTETATLLKLHRTTVTKWRLYSPEFQAALNVRRADIWGAAAAQMQMLIPKAINTLAAELETGITKHRVMIALELLKLVGPPAPPSIGPTDPEEIVRKAVRKRIARDEEEAEEEFEFEDVLDEGPTFEERKNQILSELQALADAPVPELQRIEA